MSLSSECMSPADFAAVTGNNNNDGFGGNGAWWIIILFLFAFCGWGGNNGFGGFGGNSSGAAENYVLASDFATIQRQLSDGFGGVEKGIDTIRNGLCDGFYTSAQLNAQTNMNIAQGNYNTLNAIQQNGYESRLATQTLQSAMQNCCCDIRQQISDTNYNIANQSNGISRAIENGFAQTNYNMASQNCQTLQAIDKVGDRVIDYLSNQETQRLRDEISQYRASANSQYIINELTPKCPIPAYLTCNPNAPLNYSVNYGGCGCNG